MPLPVGSVSSRFRILLRQPLKSLDVKKNQVFVSSTGVIGEPLPVERLTKAFPRLKKKLSPKIVEGRCRGNYDDGHISERGHTDS